VYENDSDFIDAYLAGEDEAVHEMDRLIRGVASSYRRKLSHRWDGVVQDIHVEVIKLLQKSAFRGESSLRTYLWRVINHTCLDKIRSQQRWQWTELEEYGEAQEITDLRMESMELSAESADFFTKILERVPAECREIWKLLFEGLSYSEMAERLVVRAGALRVRALRCRKKALRLRAELTEEG